MDNPLIWTIVGLSIYSVAVTVMLVRARAAYCIVAKSIDDTLEFIRNLDQERK